MNETQKWLNHIESQNKKLDEDTNEIKKNCPQCGCGKEGKDSYCNECYKEFLGTHAGARGHGPND